MMMNYDVPMPRTVYYYYCDYYYYAREDYYLLSRRLRVLPRLRILPRLQHHSYGYSDYYYDDESSVESTTAPDDGDILTELASDWESDDGDAPDGGDEEMEPPCEMGSDGSEHNGMSIRAAREMGEEHGM